MNRVASSREALAKAVAMGKRSTKDHSAPHGWVTHNTPANPSSTEIQRDSELASRKIKMPSRVTRIGEVHASAAAVGSAMNCSPKSQNPVDMNSQPPRTRSHGWRRLGRGKGLP